MRPSRDRSHCPPTARSWRFRTLVAFTIGTNAAPRNASSHRSARVSSTRRLRWRAPLSPNWPSLRCGAWAATRVLLAAGVHRSRCQPTDSGPEMRDDVFNWDTHRRDASALGDDRRDSNLCVPHAYQRASGLGRDPPTAPRARPGVFSVDYLISRYAQKRLRRDALSRS